jgi:hypothetical protein
MSIHERGSSRSSAGDDALDRAWQQLSDEQPPSALDAAIIAAACKSIRGRDEPAQIKRASPPQRSWLTQWQPLAAAAAVAGLAFVLVQSLPRDRDVAPLLRMEEPATAPAAAQEKPGAPAMRESIEAKTESAPAPAVVQEPVTAPAPARAEASAEASAAVAKAARDNVAPPDATDRAAGIATLYAAGDIAGAADALREFRAVDPGADSYLPESLRDWAQTVE